MVFAEMPLECMVNILETGLNWWFGLEWKTAELLEGFEMAVEGTER